VQRAIHRLPVTSLRSRLFTPPSTDHWQGNEPDILAPWQFNWAGANHTWRTQYWTRWILRAYYTPDADGIPGNDDYGTLSAWAVWAYLGLYPLAGSGTYVLGSPVWANATLAVPAAWEVDAPPFNATAAARPPRPVLTIVAHNASAANVFAYRAAANGVPLTTPFVEHAALFPPSRGAPAGRLDFWMTDAPSPWRSE